ncbi:MAG: hypothetical protein ABFR75_02535 [Acidobacteriota bacterium]
MKIISFPPVVEKNSQILIPGTIPGRISLEKSKYFSLPSTSPAYQLISFSDKPDKWKIITGLID